MKKCKSACERKGITLSLKVYFIDAMSGMTQGLFASLIMFLILGTLGQQLANLVGENPVSDFLGQIGAMQSSKEVVGAAIAVAIAFTLKAPMLVIAGCAFAGAVGYKLGGPASAYFAAVIACEFGKAVSKSTKVDIIVTPAVTLITGMAVAMIFGPAINTAMELLGNVVMDATKLRPVLCGIAVSVIMGLVLTAPISSAALSMMLGLSGLAAGASTAGCACQMVGFAVISFADNGVGGLVSQGLGTSMLQVPNIIKNPWILLPPTLASAVVGPLASAVFKMTNNAAGAGMGTSGLVGQFATIADMGMSGSVLLEILLIHIVLPAILSYLIYLPLKKMGKIKPGDMKLA